MMKGTLTPQSYERARARADKNCPECYGDGVVTLESNNNPSTQRDVWCECTHDPDNDDHWQEEDWTRWAR